MGLNDPGLIRQFRQRPLGGEPEALVFVREQGRPLHRGELCRSPGRKIGQSCGAESGYRIGI